MRSLRTPLVLTVTAALAFAACGADDDTKINTAGSDATTTTVGEPAAADLECPADAGEAIAADADPFTEIDARGKPTVSVPAEPATELCSIDDIVGAGDEVPEGATVTVHYVGVGQDSRQQFDSSWDSGQPATFPLDSVIAGWTQGIPGMQAGGRRTLVIPGSLAYGDASPTDAIAANETLVFVIDLISFEVPPPPPTPVEAGLVCPGETGPPSAGGDDVAAEITARGKPVMRVPDAPATELCFIDDIVGTGAEVPNDPATSVTVHYVGVGQQSKLQFDASWDRSEPASFALNGVIAGWTQGIPGMKVGGRRTLVIPGALAYGETPGSPDIQPNETLVFTIDLIAIG